MRPSSHHPPGGGLLERAAEDLLEDLEAAITFKPHSHPTTEDVAFAEGGVLPPRTDDDDVERGGDSSSGGSASSVQALTAAVKGKSASRQIDNSLQPPPPPGKYDYPKRPLPSYAISKGCPPPPCYKKKIGRFYVYAETSDGSPLCMVGPCWPMYFVTFTLIAGGTGAILGGLARDVIALCIVGAILALITLTALTLTACRDPGIIPRRQERLDSDEIYDERALTYRPRGAMFEQETGTIIQDIDHFCPWTSTVIAGSNIITFKIFTSTLCLLILFCIGIAIWSVTKLGPTPGSG